MFEIYILVEKTEFSFMVVYLEIFFQTKSKKFSSSIGGIDQLGWFFVVVNYRVLSILDDTICHLKL